MNEYFQDWIERVGPLVLMLAGVVYAMVTLSGCQLHLHYHAESPPQTVLELPDLGQTKPGETYVLELPQ